MRTHILLSLIAVTVEATPGGWSTSEVPSAPKGPYSYPKAPASSQSVAAGWGHSIETWSSSAKASSYKPSETWKSSTWETSKPTLWSPTPCTTSASSTKAPASSQSIAAGWGHSIETWSSSAKASSYKPSVTWKSSTWETSKPTLSSPTPCTTSASSTKAPASSQSIAAGWGHSIETWSSSAKAPSYKPSETWKSSSWETSKPTLWSPTPCTTSASSIFTCPHVCHLDFFGTFLAYPTAIEYTPVYAQTVNVYLTEYSDGSPGQSSEVTVTAPPAVAQPPLTWTAFGVVLTFPTTYVAYTSINYATVLPITSESVCFTTTSPLQYPTIWPSLIAPSSEIQQPGSIPPAKIIAWLDTVPTVQAQLGGGVCDPENGGIAPFVATATVTSATTIDGNTQIVHTTSISVTPTPTTPPPSSTPTVVVVTTNAAVPRKPNAKSWLGNALAAIVLAI